MPPERTEGRKPVQGKWLHRFVIEDIILREFSSNLRVNIGMEEQS